MNTNDRKCLFKNQNLSQQMILITNKLNSFKLQPNKLTVVSGADQQKVRAQTKSPAASLRLRKSAGSRRCWLSSHVQPLFAPKHQNQRAEQYFTPFATSHDTWQSPQEMDVEEVCVCMCVSGTLTINAL